MKRIGRFTLLVLLLSSLPCWASGDAQAATATITLLPGKLAITDAPATLTYVATTKTESARTFATQFTVFVTDATGSLAGWHIQAVLGPFISAAGTSPLLRTSTITGASVATLTGRAPASAFAYPRPFRPDGDTIFSAADQSGMGRSSMTIAAEASIPAETADSDQYTAALSVTIISGP